MTTTAATTTPGGRIGARAAATTVHLNAAGHPAETVHPDGTVRLTWQAGPVTMAITHRFGDVSNLWIHDRDTDEEWKTSGPDALIAVLAAPTAERIRDLRHN